MLFRSALFLLQRVRDEAHRFAITYHRSKRARALVESVLDEIPGLGESRRKALLQQFPSLTALKKASAEEISQVPGIGAELAHRIHEWSQAEQTGLSIDMSTGEILE